jgi:hypothetical protein
LSGTEHLPRRTNSPASRETASFCLDSFRVISGASWAIAMATQQCPGAAGGDEWFATIAITSSPTTSSLLLVRGSHRTSRCHPTPTPEHQSPAQPYAAGGCWLARPGPTPASGADCRSPTRTGAPQVTIETPGPGDTRNDPAGARRSRIRHRSGHLDIAAGPATSPGGGDRALRRQSARSGRSLGRRCSRGLSGGWGTDAIARGRAFSTPSRHSCRDPRA